MAVFSTSPAGGLLISSLHGRKPRLFDESDLAALGERDPGAQERLVQAFSRPVLVKLRAFLRSPELVQDAYQETFLRVLAYFGSGKTLHNPAGLSSFIQTTCHHVALELLRGHTRQCQLPEDFSEPVSDEPDPEGQLVTEERKGFVKRLLTSLSPKDQQLLKRVFLDEDDKDTICRDFQVDRAYLRVLLFRARKSCRAIVSERDSARKAGDRTPKEAPSGSTPAHVRFRDANGPHKSS